MFLPCTLARRSVTHTHARFARRYFENLPLHLKLFSHVDNTDDDAIDMAFDKKHPEVRHERGECVE